MSEINEKSAVAKELSAVSDPTVKQKAAAKTARIPIKIVPFEQLKKPSWIRVKAGSPSTRNRGRPSSVRPIDGRAGPRSANGTATAWFDCAPLACA